MDNLPRAPKDLNSINRLLENLSREELETLYNMDEYSREWFFDSLQYKIESKKKASKRECAGAVTFFLTVTAIFALAAVSILNAPTSSLSGAFYVFAIFSLMAIAGKFIALPIRAIYSSVNKIDFSLEKQIAFHNETEYGLFLFTVFIWALLAMS